MRTLISAFLSFGLSAFINTAFGQDTTYKAVTQQLFAIDELDQKYRNQIDEVESKYGKGSAEIKALYDSMTLADSMNLIQVESIIEKYGWLGYNEIGSQANSTLFMVIQHADLKTWRKYLPIMETAVESGKAKVADLALLQDRLNLYEGRKQVYGSQVIWSKTNNKYFVLPIDDPDNVDKRRATVGLPSMAVYLSFLELKWNPEEYKKDLPLIMDEWKSMLH
jgi:hypothetical protein